MASPEQLRCPGACQDPPLVSTLSADQPAPPVTSDSGDDENDYNEDDHKNDYNDDDDDDYNEDDMFDDGTTCAGERFTIQQQKKIFNDWLEAYLNRIEDYHKLIEESRGHEDANLPPGPMKVLPVTTDFCTRKSFCYHREYLTDDTSETAKTLGYDTPESMLQIFSLRLSSIGSYPVSVYGIFAVRDEFEPLRNYVFNRPRDDPVTIDADYFTLPLCSPC